MSEAPTAAPAASADRPTPVPGPLGDVGGVPRKAAKFASRVDAHAPSGEGRPSSAAPVDVQARRRAQLLVEIRARAEAEEAIAPSSDDVTRRAPVRRVFAAGGVAVEAARAGPVGVGWYTPSRSQPGSRGARSDSLTVQQRVRFRSSDTDPFTYGVFTGESRVTTGGKGGAEGKEVSVLVGRDQVWVKLGMVEAQPALHPATQPPESLQTVLDDIARESEEATRSKMIDACARVEQHYLSVLAASKAAEDKKTTRSSRSAMLLATVGSTPFVSLDATRSSAVRRSSSSVAITACSVALTSSKRASRSSRVRSLWASTASLFRVTTSLTRE
jgi:hypothetical protein